MIIPPFHGYIHTPEGWHFADKLIPPFIQTDDVEFATAVIRYKTRCGMISTYAPEMGMHGESPVCEGCKNGEATGLSVPTP